ncbi:MAG: hypothetical protein HY814_14535, partial [Candidatus Riflebacteria bacterium]|nr:hypothetical protein [Candidatus Riflebacteria bacterium]
MGTGTLCLRGLVTACATMLVMGCGLVVAPRLAHDVVAAELQPLDGELGQLQALLAEIERRAQQRVAQLQKWVEWWTKVKEFADETATKLSNDFAERIANAAKAAGTLGGLSGSSPPGKRHLPHFGWHDTATLAKLASDLQKEHGKAVELAAALKAEWHIAAVGWATGQVIQRHIDETEKQIRDLNQGLRDGSFELHVAGYGWTRGSRARNRIAELEKQRQGIRDRVFSGDYEVAIPGLGLRTRKKLEAEIAGVEAELEKRRAEAARGDLKIHRPAFDWMTQKQLREDLDAGAKSFEAMKKAVADGVYNAWLVETGWAKRVDLERRVQELDASLAKARDALAKGNYRAQLPVGWATANELNKALEDLGKQLGNPKLDAKAREHLSKQLEEHRKSLAELQAVSAFDLLILG